MKKILVTGGAGFVGSHLCRRLIENNHIVCVDNLHTGKLENIEDFITRSNFEFHEHDICNPFFMSDIDEIYHMACPASPIHYQSNPIKTLKTSVLGSINLLGLAKKNNAKILLASTSEVYGDPSMHPQKEDYWGNVNPVGVRSCYDEGKRCAETLFMDYHREHQLRIKIIRIFNTYGPNMDVNDGRVVSNFINQALANKDITVYGNGTQTRSFQYVDDLVNGIISMMESGDEVKGPINLGNPNEFTILELAEIILSKTNSKSKIIFEPLPSDDPKQRKPDITQAKSNLNNWEPNIQLDKGLDKTIKYFKNLNAYS